MSSIFQSTCTFFSIYFFVFLFQFVLRSSSSTSSHRSSLLLHLLIVKSEKHFLHRSSLKKKCNFSRSLANIIFPSSQTKKLHNSLAALLCVVHCSTYKIPLTHFSSSLALSLHWTMSCKIAKIAFPFFSLLFLQFSSSTGWIFRYFLFHMQQK